MAPTPALSRTLITEETRAAIREVAVVAGITESAPEEMEANVIRATVVEMVVGGQQK
jgi:hypothetical protein